MNTHKFTNLKNLNKFTNLKKLNKFTNLKNLKRINKNSIATGYNRNIEWKGFYDAFHTGMKMRDDVVWRGMNTNVIIDAVMIHSHKNGKPCEDHIRCIVYTDNCVKDLILDMPFAEFESLEDFEELKAA